MPQTAPNPAALDNKLPQVKAEVLRDKTLATAGLGGLDPEATLAIYAAALLAESEDGYTAAAALGILQRARRITLDSLAIAVSSVTVQLASAMSSFWDNFIKQTWQGPGNPPQYVDAQIVTGRKDQEEAEQEQNRKTAVAYINNAQIAISALGIEEREFPKPPEDKSKAKPRFDFNPGKVVHGLVFKDSPEGKEPVAKPVPGWLTPPLIESTDEDVMVFDNDIMDIIGARKLSGDQAWNKLEGRGYDRTRIVLAIYNVRKLAQDQIGQCDQILSFIRSDYETHIAPVVTTAVTLGHAISTVNSFYGPLRGASSGDSTARAVTSSSQRPMRR